MSFLGSIVAVYSRRNEESLVYQFNCATRITVSIVQDQMN